jgi:hypothetical protein
LQPTAALSCVLIAQHAKLPFNDSHLTCVDKTSDHGRNR